jgi:hypothetical protein
LTRTPYKEIDPPVRNLIRVLNRFPGIATYTSCGGHAEQENDCQPQEGMWYVDFNVDRGDEGWISLEFFAWIAYGVAPDDVALRAFAKPPYLNFPGSMMFFRWSGHNPDDPKCSADSFAELLSDTRRQCYVTAHQAAQWPDER